MAASRRVLENQRKKPGNWSCTPCVENGLRAEREMDRMPAAADDNGDARQEARRKARREFRAAAAAPAAAPRAAAPAPGPAPRPPGLERRGACRPAPSSLTEAAPASAPADLSAGDLAIGRSRPRTRTPSSSSRYSATNSAASPTVAAATDAVPRGSYAFECVVSRSRCGVGTARSKKDAKERAVRSRPGPSQRQPPGAAPTSREAYTDRTRAPGRRGAADGRARAAPARPGAAAANAAVEPVAAAGRPLWQRAPGPQVGPPGFLRPFI